MNTLNIDPKNGLVARVREILNMQGPEYKTFFMGNTVTCLARAFRCRYRSAVEETFVTILQKVFAILLTCTSDDNHGKKYRHW